MTCDRGFEIELHLFFGEIPSVGGLDKQSEKSNGSDALGACDSAEKAFVGNEPVGPMTPAIGEGVLVARAEGFGFKVGLREIHDQSAGLEECLEEFLLEKTSARIEDFINNTGQNGDLTFEKVLKEMA